MFGPQGSKGGSSHFRFILLLSLFLTPRRSLLAEGQENRMPNFNYKIAAPAGIAFNKIGHLKISYVQHLFFQTLANPGRGRQLSKKRHMPPSLIT